MLIVSIRKILSGSLWNEKLTAILGKPDERN